MADLTAASSVTSTFQKAASHVFAESSAASAWPSFSITSKMATLAPSSAMRSTQARPMPTAPPVTTAVFPRSLFMGPSPFR
jgi:hypothetical protein